MYDNKF